MKPDELRELRGAYESFPDAVAPPVQQVIDRGRSMAARRRLVGTGVGAVLAIGLAAIFLTTFSRMGGGSEVVEHAQGSQPTVQSSPTSEQRGIVIDIQKESPLGGGTKLTLDQILSSTEEPLPVPPTTEETGERTAIWKSADQIAFVWSTDMRFYINRLDKETSTSQVYESWEQKARDGDWVLTSVRGHPALGHERTADSSSSLTFIDRDFDLQFVAPSHSLDQLEEFAEAITYGGENAPPPERAQERTEIPPPERLQERREIPVAGVILLPPGPEDRAAVTADEALSLAQDEASGFGEPSSIVRKLALYTNEHRKTQAPGASAHDRPTELVHVNVLVWFVTFDSVCVPSHGPPAFPKELGEEVTPEPQEPGCAGTEANVVLNAKTGKWIGTFSYR